jgi:hypothetical protein
MKMETEMFTESFGIFQYSMQPIPENRYHKPYSFI